MNLRLTAIIILVLTFSLNLFVEDCRSTPLLNVSQVQAPFSGSTVNNIDYCSYGDDCVASAEQTSLYGSARGRVEVSDGLTMSAFTYGKDIPTGPATSNATSRISMIDSFTLNTIEGPSNTIYSAVQNFIFDGNLFVPYVNDEKSFASINFDISASQAGGNSTSYGFSMYAEYDSRATDPYGLNVVTSGDANLLTMATQTDVSDSEIGLSGRLFQWDNILLGMPLENFQADLQTNVQIGLNSQVSGWGGRSDFFNTFKTDTNAPFVITEGPGEVLYQLTTPRTGGDGYDGSLFGSVELDGEILSAPSSVPIPGAIWLLGSSLIGIVGIRRKLKK